MEEKVPTEPKAIPAEPSKEVHPALLRLAGLLGKIEAQRWIAENAAKKSAAPDTSTPTEGTDAK